MRAASFFWVGSDAEIGGVRASFYVPYDGKIPNRVRVAQVIRWLKLPPAQRLDRVVGSLADQVKELNLPVLNCNEPVVVIDHVRPAQEVAAFFAAQTGDHGFDPALMPEIRI